RGLVRAAVKRFGILPIWHCSCRSLDCPDAANPTSQERAARAPSMEVRLRSPRSQGIAASHGLLHAGVKKDIAMKPTTFAAISVLALSTPALSQNDQKLAIPAFFPRIDSCTTVGPGCSKPALGSDWSR